MRKQIEIENGQFHFYAFRVSTKFHFSSYYFNLNKVTLSSLLRVAKSAFRPTVLVANGPRSLDKDLLWSL